MNEKQTEDDGGPVAAMSLRDHFAGLAMQGMLAENSNAHSFEDYAKYSYLCADAMIAERGKR